MACNGKHAVAGDAGECGVGQRRGVEHAVAHNKNILAGTFADQSVYVEGNALFVTVGFGLHANELGVHVVGAGLCQGGQGIGGEAVPTGNANVRAAVASDVLAPRKVSDVDLNGRTFGADADFAVPTESDRADIARRNSIGFNYIYDSGAELFKREGQFHAVNLG